MLIKFKNRQGFTLIELMIVITVIAILMTIAVVSFTRVQKQARDTKRKGDIRAVATALQAYYTEKNAYPPTPLNSTNLPAIYIPTIPVDPQTKLDYQYNTDTVTTYAVCALLETSDPLKKYWKVSALNSGGYATADAGCAAE